MGAVLVQVSLFHSGLEEKFRTLGHVSPCKNDDPLVQLEPHVGSIFDKTTG